MNDFNPSAASPSALADSAAIFIVEDEAMIALELQDNLEALGYRVCGHAARGETALEKIRVAKPDLVLMDIHLAGEMNGIETATELSQPGSAAVVFLSAYSDPALLERAMNAGPYGYLVKPTTERSLHATIEVALHWQRRERDFRQSHAECEERVTQLQNAARSAGKWPLAMKVCPHCHAVDPGDGWKSLERFFASLPGTEIDYAACPQCQKIRGSGPAPLS